MLLEMVFAQPGIRMTGRKSPVFFLEVPAKSGLLKHFTKFQEKDPLPSALSVGFPFSGGFSSSGIWREAWIWSLPLLV